MAIRLPKCSQNGLNIFYSYFIHFRCPMFPNASSPQQPQRPPFNSQRAYTTNSQGMSSDVPRVYQTEGSSQNSHQFPNTLSQRDMNSSMAYNTPNGQGMSSDVPPPPDVRIEGKITLGSQTYEFTDVMIFNENFYINMIVEMPNKSTFQADMYINNKNEFYFAPCIRHKRYRRYKGENSGRYDLGLVIKKHTEMYEPNQKIISSKFWNEAKITIKGTEISIEKFYQMYTGEKLKYFLGGNRKSKSLNRRTRKSKPAVL